MSTVAPTAGDRAPAPQEAAHSRILAAMSATAQKN